LNMSNIASSPEVGQPLSAQGLKEDCWLVCGNEKKAASLSQDGPFSFVFADWPS
jgi:hypothetical protein